MRCASAPPPNRTAWIAPPRRARAAAFDPWGSRRLTFREPVSMPARAKGVSALLLEESAHRLGAMNAKDRVREQRRDGDDLHERRRLGDRNRVGEINLLGAARREALARRAAEHRVRRADVDLLGAELLHD